MNPMPNLASPFETSRFTCFQNNLDRFPGQETCHKGEMLVDRGGFGEKGHCHVITGKVSHVVVPLLELS
jgi:hypothetical protein